MNAIYFKASLDCQKGLRGNPGDELYNKFTDKEMKDINSLYHNRAIATDWLFKGHTKEIPAVGEIPRDEQGEEKEKLQKSATMESTINRSATMDGGRSLDIESIMS